MFPFPKSRPNVSFQAEEHPLHFISALQMEKLKYQKAFS